MTLEYLTLESFHLLSPFHNKCHYHYRSQTLAKVSHLLFLPSPLPDKKEKQKSGATEILSNSYDMIAVTMQYS